MPSATGQQNHLHGGPGGGPGVGFGEGGPPGAAGTPHNPGSVEF